MQNLLDDRDDVGWGPNNKFKFPLLGTGLLYDRIAEALPKPVELEKAAVEIAPVAKVITSPMARRPPMTAWSAMPIKELVSASTAVRPWQPAAGDLHHTEGLFVGIGVADSCPSTEVLDVLSRTRPSTG